MEKKLMEILEAAMKERSTILTGLNFGFDATLDINRGRLQGLLQAAGILTGKTYEMEPDGIYCNGELVWKS